MANATHHRKAATGLISLVAIGLLLESNLSLYQLEDILISWLFFNLAFVLLTLLILAVILVAYAGEYVVHWASTAPRVISTVALRLSESYSRIIPAENRSEFHATNSE